MVAALTVFFAALLPRLAYLVWARPPFLGEYWLASTGILQQHALAIDGTPTARLEPLYPLFLAAARALTGSVAAVQSIQAAVASLGAVALFFAAEALTGSRRIAWIAAVLYAVDPLLVRHAADSSDSALVTVLLIFFACVFVRARSVAGAAGAGAALGLVILTRAMTLPIALVGTVACARRRGATHGAALAVAAAAIAAPMLAHNWRVSGSMLPAREGVNLFIGNSIYTSSLLPDYSPDILQEYAYGEAARMMHGVNRGSAPSRDEADPILGRLAWESMRAHPARTLALKGRNVLYFFSPQLMPSHLIGPESAVRLEPDGAASVSNAPLRPLAERVGYGGASLLVLLAAAAGVSVRRRDLRRDAVLWTILATFVAVYALYFPATRYTAPVRFVLLFYAAVGIDFTLERRARAELR